MNSRSFLFCLLCGFAAWGLPSCEFFKELVEEAPIPVKKVYAPGELKADEIEKIALSEVGKREGTDINFRSDGVQDREDLYYVSVVARPYRPDGRRTVVVNDQGEVVQYMTGNRLPKYAGATAPVKKAASPVQAVPRALAPVSAAPDLTEEEIPHDVSPSVFLVPGSRREPGKMLPPAGEE